jgi:iron complex outermembrane receptor protein
MKSAAIWCAGALLVWSGSVVAQQAQQPVVTLPQLTVEGKKAAPAKKAAPKRAVTQAQPVAEPAQAISGPPAGTASGPVDGYVATQTSTGSKTDTPIIEIPRTVNVVTRDQIEAQQPQSVREALGYTPNVQNQTGSSSILDNIAVRGFTAPIFLDGLLLPTDGAIGFSRIRLEPYGLERLEVLKGPASGLFGQSPPGGLINATSKRPQDEPHNEVFVQYGTNNYRATGFDFTGPLTSSGDVAYRIVGLARDTDLDFDFADRQRFFLAPSLKWRISGDTTLTVLGSVQKDSGFGPFQFVPFELTKSSAPFGRISRKTYLGEPSLDDYTETQWQLGYSLEHRFNSALQFRQNLRYADTDQDIVAMRAAGVQANMRTINRSANAVLATAQGLSIDNQLQWDFTTADLKHRVLVGLDYQHVDSSSGFWVRSPGVPTIDAYNPVYGSPVPSPFTGANFVLSDGTLQQTGVYLQDQIKLGRWIATLGLRHDWATTDLDDNRVGAAVPHQRIDDEAWTGNAGLTYVFDNGFAPYINYSTSFLPATGSSLINASTGQPLKPTTGEGYEAGIKYQPPGTRTLITAAVFQITQQNISTTNPSNGAITQTGEVRMRGFEIDGRTSLNRNFDVIAGYGYIEPIITETLPLSNVGNDFQQVSRHTASAWGVYTWHEGPLAGVALGAGVRYVGSQYAEAANTHKLSEFTLVDAMASYDLTNVGLKGTKLQLNAYNLFDTYYVATCQGKDFCQLGQSRSVLATLKYEW